MGTLQGVPIVFWGTMDARGVQRLLEKTYALAEGAEAVGGRSTETVLRESGLSDVAKQKLRS